MLSFHHSSACRRDGGGGGIVCSISAENGCHSGCLQSLRKVCRCDLHLDVLLQLLLVLLMLVLLKKLLLLLFHCLLLLLLLLKHLHHMVLWRGLSLKPSPSRLSKRWL